jgi:hypothetical protein
MNGGFKHEWQGKRRENCWEHFRGEEHHKMLIETENR